MDERAIAAQVPRHWPTATRCGTGSGAAAFVADAVAAHRVITVEVGADRDAAGRRITLYIRPAFDGPDTSFRFAQDGNVQAFYWRDNGLAWAVTGNLDRVTLSAIAEEVYGALNS